MQFIIILVYLIGLGFIGYLLARIMDVEGMDDEDFIPIWLLGTILWPLAFPILLGYGISRLFFK